MSELSYDLVTHKGQVRLLADLAHYMDYEEREAVHFDVAPCSDQEFWDAFSARFPASADHLVEITPARESDEFEGI
jgi:hypothetical protein